MGHQPPRHVGQQRALRDQVERVAQKVAAGQRFKGGFILLRVGQKTRELGLGGAHHAGARAGQAERLVILDVKVDGGEQHILLAFKIAVERLARHLGLLAQVLHRDLVIVVGVQHLQQAAHNVALPCGGLGRFAVFVHKGLLGGNAGNDVKRWFWAAAAGAPPKSKNTLL